MTNVTKIHVHVEPGKEFVEAKADGKIPEHIHDALDLYAEVHRALGNEINDIIIGNDDTKVLISINGEEAWFSPENALRIAQAIVDSSAAISVGGR